MMHFSGPGMRTRPSSKSRRNLGGRGTLPFSSTRYSNSPRNMAQLGQTLPPLTTFYHLLPFKDTGVDLSIPLATIFWWFREVGKYWEMIRLHPEANSSPISALASLG